LDLRDLRRRLQPLPAALLRRRHPGLALRGDRAGAGARLPLDPDHQLRPGRAGDVRHLPGLGGARAPRPRDRDRGGARGDRLGAGVLERGLVRPFDPENHLAITMVTLGLYLAVGSFAGLLWGFEPKGFPSLFPNGTGDNTRT